MKNILAENLLRFGVKNLSEADKSKLNEQTSISRLDWANKQTAAIKNLSAQYMAEKWPIEPVVIGPYCLLTQNNISGVNAQKIKEGTAYQGDVIAWTNRRGLPSPLSINECNYFTFHPADKFKNFFVETAPLGTDIGYLNQCYNGLPLATIQAMWKNIGQASELSKMMPTFKTNILAYQANPTDATKGYDKIVGNAAAFFKSVKFA